MTYGLLDIDEEDGVTKWWVEYFDTEEWGGDGESEIDYVGVTYTLDTEEALKFECEEDAISMMEVTGFNMFQVVCIQ